MTSLVPWFENVYTKLRWNLYTWIWTKILMLKSLANMVVFLEGSIPVKIQTILPEKNTSAFIRTETSRFHRPRQCNGSWLKSRKVVYSPYIVGRAMCALTWCTNPFAVSGSHAFTSWPTLARNETNQEKDSFDLLAFLSIRTLVSDPVCATNNCIKFDLCQLGLHHCHFADAHVCSRVRKACITF